MKKEIVIPAMGESVTEATIGKFLKPHGAVVQENEEIVELETEKVNQVLYASAAGKVEWTVKEGETRKIGDQIGSIDTEFKAAAIESPKEKPAEKKKKPVEKSTPPPSKEEKESLRFTQEAFIQELKSPKPSNVPQPSKEEPPKQAMPQPSKDQKETRRPLSKIRKTIGTRMVEALRGSAMLTTFNEVDMSAVIDLRTRHKESFSKKHGVKLGFMSFFVKAVVDALKTYPVVNSYIDGNEVVERHSYDISIAVGTERGLVVPVVRGCDRLSFAQIEKEIETYAKKAREGGLTIEDLRGGSFTITNGGVYGSLLSTPILNPPQCAILGMHKIEKRPIVIGDQIAIRPMMYLAMSYDHRLIDGKEAVTFLVRIKEVLEDPSLLLFDGE